MVSDWLPINLWLIAFESHSCQTLSSDQKNAFRVLYVCSAEPMPIGDQSHQKALKGIGSHWKAMVFVSAFMAVLGALGEDAL